MGGTPHVAHGREASPERSRGTLCGTHLRFAHLPVNRSIAQHPDLGGTRRSPRDTFVAAQRRSRALRGTIPSPGTHVELAVYNLVGQRVRTLVAEIRQAGRFRITWDSRDDLGRDVSSGVYFYKIEAGEFQDVKKMILVR